jgi:ubiquinone/menaquinone biosynthesis C-methylase UbiE
MFGPSAPLPSLVDALRSPLALVRSAAIDALLARCWRESAGAPGVGLITAEGVAAVPLLLASLADPTLTETHRAAVLLAMLFEGEPSPDATRAEVDGTRSAIAQALPSFLDGLTRAARAVDPANHRSDPAVQAWIYLLGHFGDEVERIAAATHESLVGGSRVHDTLVMVLRLAASQSSQAASVLTYLGAAACAKAFDYRYQRVAAAIGCPICKSALSYDDRRASCGQCAVAFDYHGEMLDLVPPGDATVDEFPEEVASTYESQRRPRFVAAMANDWRGSITAEREARYLEAHLAPARGPVLDLGCGSGSRTAMVAAVTGAERIIALDYSASMLAACATAVPMAVTVRANVSSLPVRTATIGAVNCSDALQAFPDPAASLREIARVLEPGAPFVCFTFTDAAEPYRYFQHRLSPWRRTLFSRNGLTDAIRNAGFEVTDLATAHDGLFLTAIRAGQA